MSGNNLTTTKSSLCTSTGIFVAFYDMTAEGSVSFNGNAPISLTGVNLTLDRISLAAGGIGGGVSTINATMTVPGGQITTGSNTITWTVLTTDGNTAGYRVLSFNLIQDGTNLISSNQFVYANPATWIPPLNNPTDINAGKSLFQTGSLTQPNPSYSGSPASITAHCSSCHSVDGSDLKYFNYSIPVIEARCAFHGMTSTQQQQVASYIISLTSPNPSFPWYPVYQPGPGLDQGPVTSWAAGAGLNGILPSDEAMLPYAFPRGGDAVDWNLSGHVMQHNIPIQFPILTWNQWLPVVYPGDAFGATFTSSAVLSDYGTLVSNLLPGNPSNYASNASNFTTFDNDEVALVNSSKLVMAALIIIGLQRRPRICIPLTNGMRSSNSS